MRGAGEPDLIVTSAPTTEMVAGMVLMLLLERKCMSTNEVVREVRSKVDPIAQVGEHKIRAALRVLAVHGLAVPHHRETWTYWCLPHVPPPKIKPRSWRRWRA